VSTWLITKLLAKCLLIPQNNCSPTHILCLNHTQGWLSKMCLSLHVLIRCFTYSSAASSNIFSDIRNWTARREQGVSQGCFSFLQSSCNGRNVIMTIMYISIISTLSFHSRHGFQSNRSTTLIACLSVTTQQPFKISFALMLHNGFIDYNSILLHVSAYESHRQAVIH
jgi:hypothetical protein